MKQEVLWKQTLTQKLIHCMQELEKDGMNIPTASTTDLTFSFYYRHGLSNLSRSHELHHMIESGKLPTMEGVSRAIRRARALNKDWTKCDKEETVEGFACQVGYRDQPRIKELA